MRQRCEPQGEWECTLPLEMLKIRLSEPECILCVLKAVCCENKQPIANLKNVDMTVLKPLNFKMDLFGPETTLCMYFTVLENVTI